MKITKQMLAVGAGAPARAAAWPPAAAERRDGRRAR